MMRINYDFADLETFLAVLDLGSFHLAAEAMNLSQSSTTRRIQKLETALDTQLFERTTRDVKPTLAAKRLRVRAEAILTEAQETTRSLRDENAAFEHQRQQTVSIAIIPTVISQTLTEALRDLRQVHKGLRFRLFDLSANEVAEAVVHGEADFGICTVPAFEPHAQFKPLFSEELVLALPDGHPLAAQEKIAWSELEGEPLILPKRGTGNRMLIDDALAQSGQLLSWSVETGRTSTALDLTRSGVGLAPVPRSAISSSWAPQIFARPLVSPEVSRSIGFLTRLGQTHRPNVEITIDAILSHFQKQRGSVDGLTTLHPAAHKDTR